MRQLAPLLAQQKRIQDLVDDVLRQQRTVQSAVDAAKAVVEGSSAIEQAQRLNEQLQVVSKASQGYSELQAVAAQLATTYQPVMDSVWPAISRAAELSRTVMYPPNWAGIQDISLDKVRDIGENEGVPIMWVPRPGIVKELLTAGDSNGRRDVLVRYRASIADDCRSALEEIEVGSVADERTDALETGVQFGLQVCAALSSGHLAASQALATTLLDTIIERLLVSDTHKELATGKRVSQFDADQYNFRAALTLGPVWAAHKFFVRQQRDVIPVEYGRHPSVHGVSVRQYNEANAIIAAMLVTSVLKFYSEVGTSERHEAAL